jgi:hypothetical protein
MLPIKNFKNQFFEIQRGHNILITTKSMHAIVTNPLFLGLYIPCRKVDAW